MISPWDIEDAAFTHAVEQYRAANDDLQNLAARLAAHTVLTVYPTARFLELDVTDQGSDTMVPVAIHLEDGTMLDFYIGGPIPNDTVVSVEFFLGFMTDDHVSWSRYVTHPFDRHRPYLDLHAATRDVETPTPRSAP